MSRFDFHHHDHYRMHGHDRPHRHHHRPDVCDSGIYRRPVYQSYDSGWGRGFDNFGAENDFNQSGFYQSSYTPNNEGSSFLGGLAIGGLLGFLFTKLFGRKHEHHHESEPKHIQEQQNNQPQETRFNRDNISREEARLQEELDAAREYKLALKNNDSVTPPKVVHLPFPVKKDETNVAPGDIDAADTDPTVPKPALVATPAPQPAPVTTPVPTPTPAVETKPPVKQEDKNEVKDTPQKKTPKKAHKKTTSGQPHKKAEPPKQEDLKRYRDFGFRQDKPGAIQNHMLGSVKIQPALYEYEPLKF